MIEIVRERYNRVWGRPSASALLREQGGTPIEVATWAGEVAPSGITMYATIGASAFPLPDRDESHRVEYYAGSDPPVGDWPDRLAALASFPLRASVAIGHDHSVTFQEPLWPGTDMRTLLLLDFGDEFIPSLVLPSGLHVQFLSAIPIYPSELAFRQAHGLDALLTQWENGGVEFSDPHRRASTG